MKKAIKKVASGLVRDAEKIWFAELSDKGKVIINYPLFTGQLNNFITININI